jgi:hypothetical protein
MHRSWRRARAATWKPIDWMLTEVPALAISPATSHGSGGAQLSPPSETRTIEAGAPAGRSAAAARSACPIGVEPVAR